MWKIIRKQLSGAFKLNFIIIIIYVDDQGRVRMKDAVKEKEMKMR